MGETMQPDPDRYDDDPEEQADELTEADDESATGFKSLGGELGRAMGNLERTLTEKGVITSGAQSRAQEDEPPFALPLIDEEELAAIKDPTERARSRRNRIELYKNHPDALAHYMERSEQLKAERNKVVMLTPWSDDRRAAPNAVFRSALFPALNNKKSRRFVQNHKIYSVSGLDVTFTGQQFDQTDLDVYLEILNLAKAVPLGQPVRFSAYSLLKALGWGVGGNKHKRLHLVLVRLCGGVVEATDHKARYFGQLIFGGVRDEITNDYEITINPNFAKLFGFGLWSSIDLDQRRQLERKGTTRLLFHAHRARLTPLRHPRPACRVGGQEPPRCESKPYPGARGIKAGWFSGQL
jgi:hypothetical protein